GRARGKQLSAAEINQQLLRILHKLRRLEATKISKPTYFDSLSFTKSSKVIINEILRLAQ
ncbi:hypothetical protein, partial [Oceanobacillus damuensis]|uniref:hypothetical protein n=1 Tax=Oceanobacillus damuensis TaxID=937928 RepID=UPI000A6EE3F2